MTFSSWWCQHAWLPGGLASGVRIVVEEGVIKQIECDVEPQPEDTRLDGVTLPGMSNTHSHVFHRALRGRTQDGFNFWSWRDVMYAIADNLNPDTYLQIARAVFAEMALAGITVVGEFHYVHHRDGGKPYGDPNAMGLALRQAAEEVGIRMTLLDTLYLEGGLTTDGHVPLEGPQLRFSDGSVDAWAERMHDRKATPMMRLGAAIHSVRSVRREHLPGAVHAAHDMPLHVHVSERVADNLATQFVHGMTPTQILADAGGLGPQTTVVHATHATEGDIAMLGESGTGACLCPTTERDLADGIGPAYALYEAGSPLSTGTDQHVFIDPFEEVRALEMHERLETNERPRFELAELVEAATINGYRALGWSDGGHLSTGALADFVTVRLDTPNTAGALPAQVVYAATMCDISTVVVAGRQIVTDGRHAFGDVGQLLAKAIARVTA